MTEHFIQTMCNEPVKSRKKSIDLVSPVLSREASESKDESTSKDQGIEFFSWVFGGQDSARKVGNKEHRKEFSATSVAKPLPHELCSRLLPLSEDIKQKWGFFCASIIDLRMISSTLSKCLSDPIDLIGSAQWSNIIALVSCIVSPWRREELGYVEVREEFDILEYSNHIEKSFDLVYNFSLQRAEKGEDWLLISLVTSIIASCQLTALASTEELKSCQYNISESNIHFHIQFVSKFQCKLVDLYGKSEITLEVRRVALLGLLTITHNSLNLISHIDEIQPEIKELCISSIDTIQSIESSPEILPSNFESDVALNGDTTYLKWLKSLKASQIQDDGEYETEGTCKGAATIGKNHNSSLHILMLVPIVMSCLKRCRSDKIREVLEQMVGTVDLGKFITDYFAQLDKAKALQEENHRLMDDLRAHKAVQSLGML